MTTTRYSVSNIQLEPKDIPLLCLCIFGLVYFGYGETAILSIFALSLSGAFIGLNAISSILEKLSTKRYRPKIWHYLLMALTVSLCFAFEVPSHALLFDALEQSAIEMLEATGGAVEEGSITAVFIFFRVVVILAFVGGAIVGVVQALQGSDWRPIATMMGIGVSLVLVIEVLTNLVIGGGTGG